MPRDAGAGAGYPERNALRAALLLFLRRNHHHHLTPLKSGHLLNLPYRIQIGSQSLKESDTKLLMSHLATAKAQRDLGFVTLIKKTDEVAQLDLVVAFIGTRSKLHFLDLDDLLLLPCLVSFLLLLVLELAIVHQATDRRLGSGGNLDQIDLGVFGHPDGIPETDDTDRFVVDADQAKLRSSDFTVDAMRTFGSSSDACNLQSIVLTGRRATDGESQDADCGWARLVAMSSESLAENTSSGNEPRSNPPRARTATVPACTSLSPTTSR